MQVINTYLTQTFESSVLALSPTLYLPLQENVGVTTYLDATVNGHNGSEKQAGHQTNAQTGAYGRRSVKFDGGSLSGITIPQGSGMAVSASGSEQISVMCIFKGNGNSGYLVSQDDSGSNRPWASSAQNVLYGFANNQAGPALYTNTDYRNDGNFHMFVFTMDDGTNECKHYVDGSATTVLGGVMGPFQATDGTTPVEIGTNTLNDFRFDGWMSDVAVWYGHIITQAEVTAMYSKLTAV